MAKREPLGKDPLEWIKRTKPADEEEEQDQAQAAPQEPPAAPQAPPEEPGPTPAEGPVEDAETWLETTSTDEAFPPVEARPAPPEPEPAQQESPAPEAAPAAPIEQPETVQAVPETDEAIQIQAPQPPAGDWPAAVVQDSAAEPDLGDDTAEQSDEEEPTQIVGAENEEEEVTAAKLMAEKQYVHVGSTDEEVDTLPKTDSNEFSAVPFPGQQESSLVYPIIMIICIILMGLLVSFWAEGRIRSLEQRLEKIEKILTRVRVSDTRR